MRRKYSLLLLLILVLFLSSCKIKTSGKEEKFEARGTDAIIMNFLRNSPPDSIRIGDADKDITIGIEIRNKGVYPIPDLKTTSQLVGKLFLGGFDRGIIKIDDNDMQVNLAGKFLEGRSYSNRLGGYDLAEIKGKIIASKIPTDTFQAVIALTACYEYRTFANAPVCIDADPYSDSRANKVCNIAPIVLTSQGAPIAVTRIDEDVISNNIQFRIHLKNLGKGDAIKSVPDSCNPYNNKILREDFDWVKVSSVKLSGNDIDNCRPLSTFDGFKYARLIDGEGFFMCTVSIKEDMKKQSSGYTTPLEIELAYTYRNVVQKNMNIVKVK